MKTPLVVIAGPTACGKTDTAINLALKINGEIISADSMQVYKYMDIGTAKVSKEDMKGVKHYLIDALYPNEDFSVAVFKDMAKACIHEIYAKGKTPIIVGGTGFYINALIYDTNFTKPVTNIEQEKYNQELYNIAQAQGATFLHNMLKEVDPEAALCIHENNIKRVVRALEYYKETGKKISTHNEEEALNKEAYETSFFILNRDRKKLYFNIEKRVDDMIKQGLVNEVKNILELGYNENLVSLNGIGYKEIIEHLKGETTLDEAIEKIKRNTRRFAKRQITWFKNKSTGIWLNMDNYDNINMAVNNIIKTIK